MQFESHGLKSGVWSGILTGPKAPSRLSVILRGEVVAEAKVTPKGEGEWQIEATLPASALSDGAHSFALVADDAPAGAPPLARLPVIAGTALDGDLVGEILLLRAELDMLKREFRHFASGN